MDRTPPTRHPAGFRSALRTTAEKAASRLGPYGAMWITLVLGGVFVVVMTYLASEVYEGVTEDDGLAGLDQPLLAWVMSWRSGALNTAITWFTHTGGTIGMPIIAILAIITLTYRSRSWRPFLLIASSALGSLAMTIAGKNLFGRARPDRADAIPPYETSPSFPSGHTLNATAIIAVIAYLWFLELEKRMARAWMIAGSAAYVVLIGLSRVYLGHHWLTDVAAAWMLGLMWAALVVLAHRVFHTVRRVRRDRQAGNAPTA
ncbi:phosphatase PAP2 family protein [Arthrobacter sp.]|uniref:phosphatase PAP2 family protein n=1 Tax=Arthrobacter sp. TaxID=1667 RepID=UPI003A8F1713